VDLKQFLSVFDERLSILESLYLPDLCSFLLFTIASKSHPTHTHRLYESENSSEYPLVDSVLEFVKNRVRVLEIAGGTLGPAKHYNRPSTSQAALVSSVKNPET